MEGRRGEPQTALLAEQDCDVWRLTEVHHRLELPDRYRMAAHSDDMARFGHRAFKWWAAIATRRKRADGDAPGNRRGAHRFDDIRRLVVISTA